MECEISLSEAASEKLGIGNANEEHLQIDLITQLRNI